MQKVVYTELILTIRSLDTYFTIDCENVTEKKRERTY